MAMSEVKICNLALSHIGCQFINSLDDSGSEATQCNLHYVACRDQTLEDFEWGFAEHTAYLTELSTEDPFGYDYAYQYPTNCARALRIYNDVPTSRPINYTVTSNATGTGKMILTDEETAALVYTRIVSNVSLFSPTFITALSWLIAHNIAGPLTGKESKAEKALKMYEFWGSRAKTLSSSQEHNDNEVECDFLAER